jgi:coenzyme PQQ synthesis protein D (PqqD)
MTHDHDHDHDHEHAHDDEAAQDAGILADALELDFAPGLVDTAAFVVLDDEAVILDEVSGATHLLNPTGTLVLQCFDGVSTLQEIATDVAEAFHAEEEVVAADLLTLARELGDRGLLVGVKARPRVQPSQPAPSLPVGTVLSGLDAQVADGPVVDDKWLGSGPALVVSWGARCGFCKRIIPDLVDLEMPLAAAGIRLMLVTTGSPEEIETQFAEAPGALPIAYTDELPDFLAGLGTPVAYAVGSGAATSELMALGALDVPQLARRLAGVHEESPTTS